MASDDKTKGGPPGTDVKNPYGGKPARGISLPPYFKAHPSITGSRANYLPLSETLGADEMQVSFVGSNPWPPRLGQAATAIIRFFFDFWLRWSAQHCRDARAGSVDQRHLHLAPICPVFAPKQTLANPSSEWLKQPVVAVRCVGKRSLKFGLADTCPTQAVRTN